MTSGQLSIYNGALRVLGERKLASLSESREPRRLLDDVWDDGGVEYCLEQGYWNHAIRSVSVDYSPSVTPPFGYRYAFDKPTDWIRTASLCSDEFFNSPLTQYDDESAYWFADIPLIYVKYVSDDVSYGFNYAAWPETFTQYVQQFFASQICLRLTQSQSKQDKIDKDLKKLLADARSKDAMNQPAKFLPPGSWVNARLSSRSRARYDRFGWG